MKWIRKLSGFLRIRQQDICEYDFHDYPDSEENQPMHFHTYKCKHCGQKFEI